MMLTRIRIEAEGSTTNGVQEEIFALYDLLIEALYSPELAPAMSLADEVYEHVPSPDPHTPRWYKGRAIIRFTNLAEHDPFACDGPALRARHDRIEAALVEAAKASALYPHTSGDQVVLGPEVFASADESVICWRGENYRKSEVALYAAPAPQGP